MAKEVRKTEDNGDDVPVRTAVAPTFAVYDQQRLADEMKDRDRLKAREPELDEEGISKLMTERQALKEEHIAKVNELKREYHKARTELDSKIGGGFRKSTTPDSMLSNETDEFGNRRYTIAG